MGGRTIALAAGDGIEVTLRESVRARRLSLRVSSLDGRVTLTVPRGAPLREAERFVRDRSDWIMAARSKVEGPVSVGPGVKVPVAGTMTMISGGAGRRGVLMINGVLEVPQVRAGVAVEVWLKERARAALAMACDAYCAMVDRQCAAITLRDTRSRWGSCTANGRLMFSWRLAMAPPEVLTYVAAHEVAHLVHMDHSTAFWGRVEQLDPEWRVQRDWLRAHGAGLHRYRFRD